MTSALRLLDFVSKMMFHAACVMVATIVLIVTYDVASRNLGLPTAVWAVNTVEYEMLFITFLCIPWLVLTRGHVSVEVLLTYMPRRLRSVWQSLLQVLAALICFYMAWHSGRMFLSTWLDGSYEMRSFDTPMWVLYVTMGPGFLFGGLQFLSFFARGKTFYGASPEAHAGM